MPESHHHHHHHQHSHYHDSPSDTCSEMQKQAIDGVLYKTWPTSKELTITFQPRPLACQPPPGCRGEYCCKKSSYCFCWGFSLFEKSSGKPVQSSFASGVAVLQGHGPDPPSFGEYRGHWSSDAGQGNVYIEQSPGGEVEVAVEFFAPAPSLNSLSYHGQGLPCDFSSSIGDQPPTGGRPPTGGYSGLVMKQLLPPQ